MSTSPLEVALAYARRGWPVFPLHTPLGDGLCSCGAPECGKSTGKHPRTARGHLDATLDAEQIRAWWARWPDANVAIRTGAEAGLVVLDVDPRHGGDETLEALERELGTLPATLEARTGGGGRHLVFAHPGGKVSSRSNIALGLDRKADGGYIAAAPSLHLSGARYEWCDPNAPIAPAPAWLLEMGAPARPPPRAEYRPMAAPSAGRYGAAALERACATVAGTPEGSRNATLFREAAPIFELVAGGELAASDAENALAEAARTAGLAEREIQRTIDSARKAGEQSPRTAPPRESARPEPPPPTDADAPGRARGGQDEERPSFQVVKGLGHEAVAFAIDALAEHATTYQRDGRLVTVAAWDAAQNTEATRREAGAPVVRDMTAPLVWERLSALVNWQKWDTRKKGPVDIDPPAPVVAAVLQRGEWPRIRELRGIIGAPALRPDGTIIDRPGYDPQTGLLFVPAGACNPIPDRPTRAQALEARDELLEVVCDFPFELPAHRAAWLAGALTPIVRPAIGDGNVPLFLVDANSRGAGKGLAVHSAAIIATGRTAPCEGFTPDAAEMDKRIVAHLQAADPIVNLDNVATDFGGPVLDKLLTSEGTYASRKLGSNDASAALKLPNLTTWWATLNNAALTGDLVRRAIHTRLATEYEHPEEREGFRHPDLLGWVRQERPRLLAAALTIARGWFVAGRPCADELSPFGSFERWSSIVRALCAWLELPDPWRDTVNGLRRADRSDDLHGALLAGLEQLDADRRGLSTGEIKRLLDLDMAEALRRDTAPRHAELLDALGAAGLVADGKVLGQKLGKRLQLYRDKRKAGAWIAEAGRDSRSGSPRWSVMSAGVQESQECGQPSAREFAWGRVTKPGGPIGGTPAHSCTPATEGAR